ncbi:hypothetical protein GCM10010406_45050 [Streptomyces thermolineatus]|uniref:Acyl-CoA carboxylase subunit epsilon n=2 Tax=Streptomyces TaxID=1883 RepID=A0ABN3MJV8_9ACTN
MGMTEMAAGALIRVERGFPDPDELAALAAALFARAAAPANSTGTEKGGVRAVARWHRLERSPGHRTPRSWRSAAPGGYGRAA